MDLLMIPALASFFLLVVAWLALPHQTVEEPRKVVVQQRSAHQARVGA